MTASRASPLSSVLLLFHSGDFAFASIPIMVFFPFKRFSTFSSCGMPISMFSVGGKYWYIDLRRSVTYLYTYAVCCAQASAVSSAVMCLLLIPTAAIGGSCFEPRQAIAISVPSPGTLLSMLYGSYIRKITLPSALICVLISRGTIFDLCMLCCRILIAR
jgi:hypothetical protein